MPARGRLSARDLLSEGDFAAMAIDPSPGRPEELERGA